MVLWSGATAVFAVIVEVQLGCDGGKRWSWPVYLTTLRARLQCPTLLLVVSVAEIASWCATPIKLGHPGLVLMPVVLGPQQVPVIIDAVAAVQTPELTVLSALAHISHPDLDKILYVGNPTLCWWRFRRRPDTVWRH